MLIRRFQFFAVLDLWHINATWAPVQMLRAQKHPLWKYKNNLTEVRIQLMIKISSQEGVCKKTRVSHEANSVN